MFVEQNGHILRHDADHHRAEADVVQGFMRLSAVEDHFGVDLSAAPQRDGLPVLDLKGGHNALKPGHFRLDIGQKRKARLIAVRAVCHQLERLRSAVLHGLRAGDGNSCGLYHHASSASAIRLSISSG